MYTSDILFADKIMTQNEYSQLMPLIRKTNPYIYKRLCGPKIDKLNFCDYVYVWVFLSYLRNETRTTREWKLAFKRETQTSWSAKYVRLFANFVRRVQMACPYMVVYNTNKQVATNELSSYRKQKRNARARVRAMKRQQHLCI